MRLAADFGHALDNRANHAFHRPVAVHGHAVVMAVIESVRPSKLIDAEAVQIRKPLDVPANLLDQLGKKRSVASGGHRISPFPRSDGFVFDVLQQRVGELLPKNAFGVFRVAALAACPAKFGHIHIGERPDLVLMHGVDERLDLRVRHRLFQRPLLGIGVRFPLRCVGHILAKMRKPEARPNETHVLPGHLLEVGVILDVVIPEHALIRSAGQRRKEVAGKVVAVRLDCRTVIGRVRVEQKSQRGWLPAAHAPVRQPQPQDTGVRPIDLQTHYMGVGRQGDGHGRIRIGLKHRDQRQHKIMCVAIANMGVGRGRERRISRQVHDAPFARRENPLPFRQHRQFDGDFMPRLRFLPGERQIPGNPALGRQQLFGNREPQCVQRMPGGRSLCGCRRQFRLESGRRAGGLVANFHPHRSMQPLLQPLGGQQRRFGPVLAKPRPGQGQQQTCARQMPYDESTSHDGIRVEVAGTSTTVRTRLF